MESFFYSSGESGILLGYWTPIYGLGAVTILLINKNLEKLKTNKGLKILLLFFISAITLSLMEILGGYLIKWIFHKVMWDYSNHKFNIGIYTSLEMSIMWGISSIILVHFIKPIMDKIISKIPKYLTYILIVLFIIDSIATIIIKS